jgi:hypothetical protein
MAFLRMSEARAAAGTRAYNLRAAEQALAEQARAFLPSKRYDVFLSHSYQDADVILGVKAIIESLGLTVYVDWVDDGGLDRSKVTVKTAEFLRVRMRQSSSMVYVHSAQSPDSKWMPWELGYFDGFKPSFVWILPLVVSSDSEFLGQEYLGLYPTIDKLAALPGRLNLGFTGLQGHSSGLNLAEAARGHGVHLKAQ